MSSVDARLLKILACPKDRGPLVPFGEDRLYNPRLHLLYRIDEGIPVLLIDEAEQVSDEQHQQIIASSGSA